MIDFELEQLKQNPDYLAVLRTYRDELSRAKEADPEHDGWIFRLTSVAEVDEEQLSGIHGKLIAFGLLKFQLAGRTDGVRYQLSRSGKQILRQLESVEENGTEANSTEEEQSAEEFPLSQSARCSA